MKEKKIKIYDVFAEIEINRTQNNEYQKTLERLTVEYKNSFLEENKTELLNEIMNYKKKMEVPGKAKLTFYSEAYDHENTLNGKITNLSTAKELSQYIKQVSEKVVVSKNEIICKMDGIGTFRGENTSNIEVGTYYLKVTDVKIEEKEEKFRGIAVIGDNRKEVVEDLIRNIDRYNSLFSEEQYKCLLTPPENPVSNFYYKGGNRLKLCYVAAKKGYEDNRWVTFNQAKENGWTVRKGEKGTVCEKWVFNRKVTNKTPDGKIVEYEEKLEKPYLSYFILFNAEQVEGIPDQKKEEKEPKILEEVIHDLVVSSPYTIETVTDNKASYNPKYDTISIPEDIFFLKEEDKLETLLHELCHATGTKTGRHKQDSNIIKEELITEVATIFLKSNLGIDFKGNHIEDHSSFPKYFKMLLEVDHHGFFRMCSEAEKTANIVSKNYELLQEKKKEIIKNSFKDLKVIYQSSDYNFNLKPLTELNGINAYQLLQKALELDLQAQEVYKTSLVVGYGKDLHKLNLNLGNNEFGKKKTIAEGLEYRFNFYKEKMEDYIKRTNRSELSERVNAQVKADSKILDKIKVEEKQFFYKKMEHKKKRIRERTRENSR